jgi:hypothetical protein
VLGGAADSAEQPAAHLNRAAANKQRPA